jgi:hypothetical protein
MTDLNVVERQTIEQVMRKTRGNKSRAAKLRYVPCLLEELVRRGFAMTNDLHMLDDRIGNWMLATRTELGKRDDTGHLVMNRLPRTVVLVSGRAPHAQSLDALLVATSDHEVVVVESIAHSYSCIKRVVPDMVIISSEVDDFATCQLLSMLRADRWSSGIPVVICPTFREQPDLDDDLSELDQETATQTLAAPMN